ncbi:hypothetical protein AK812_SmicGene28916 [Symbiodinium microadriaticum]|uniref:Uncharacterized protein n=1 Tax=Symbiodinium microadriaticum TaxID=2951 RepID=A0A1Q9D343_SYMMI|nr:hypothetical protein AK812_SmicGene28916 [Symbiodinium microadriaticum]
MGCFSGFDQGEEEMLPGALNRGPDDEDEDVVLFPKLLPSKELWFLFFDVRCSRFELAFAKLIGEEEV